MKTKRSNISFNLKTLTAAVVTASLTVSFTTVPAAAQGVVIEGGPGAVQISDKDGKPEPSTPLNNPVESKEPMAVPQIEGAGTPPTPSSPSTNVSAEDIVKPLRPLKTGESRDEVTGDFNKSDMKSVEVRQPALSIEDRKKVADLRKELNIAEAATGSSVRFRTDQLFTDDDTALLESLAKPTLSKLVEYMRLSGRNHVIVQSYYVPDKVRKSLAWNRSLALIDWMSESGGVDLEKIRAAGPKMATQPVPEENANNAVATELVSTIELELR